jgi:hypothetical protein
LKGNHGGGFKTISVAEQGTGQKLLTTTKDFDRVTSINMIKY